jgi:hypothetical protein
MIPKKHALAIALTALVASCQTTADVPTDLGGTTVLFYNQAHGVQVEYYTKNGRSYLWYPGNSRSLAGKWKKEMDGKLICFSYPSNSYNPVTKERGGDWKCRLTRNFERHVTQTCKGDVFRLASGKIPFVLKKGRSQLNDLKKTCS